MGTKNGVSSWREALMLPEPGGGAAAPQTGRPAAARLGCWTPALQRRSPSSPVGVTLPVLSVSAAPVKMDVTDITGGWQEREAASDGGGSRPEA